MKRDERQMRQWSTVCMCIRSFYPVLFELSQRSRIEGGPNVFFIHNILQIEWKIKKNGREGCCAGTRDSIIWGGMD